MTAVFTDREELSRGGNGRYRWRSARVQLAVDARSVGTGDEDLRRSCVVMLEPWRGRRADAEVPAWRRLLSQTQRHMVATIHANIYSTKE